MSELHNHRPPARTRISSKPADAHDATTELFTTISFSLIAVLAVLNVILRFHDIGMLVAQYNQF